MIICYLSLNVVVVMIFLYLCALMTTGVYFFFLSLHSFFQSIRTHSEGLTKKRQDYLEWPEYFMAVAFLSAQRSKDPSSQVPRD